jgi:methyl-accepting chemotaxis protein WspA
VNNWTLRQRILTSFAVVIAIMMLMVVVSYSRLLSIESSEKSVRSDSLPGIYYSSLIRDVWVDDYVLVQQLIGQASGRDMTQADKEFERFEQGLKNSMASYRTTIFEKDDQANYDEFERLHDNYDKLLEEVRNAYEHKDIEQARRIFAEQLTPAWMDGRKQLDRIIERNRNEAESATDSIVSAVEVAKLIMGISLLIAVIIAGLCGLLLMRAINAPMQGIVQILESMRTGDLSSRLNLERKDEFGAVETGFNDMMTELVSLVSQAQRSSVQVTTSVTEIAATSKQQQATATETAATTTEIGATSREIAATSRDLVRTMTEVSTAADQASVLAGSGPECVKTSKPTLAMISQDFIARVAHETLYSR